MDVLASPVLLEARPLENEPCPLKDDTHTLEGESGGNTKTSQVHPELDEKTAINNLQQSTTDTAKDRVCVTSSTSNTHCYLCWQCFSLFLVTENVSHHVLVCCTEKCFSLFLLTVLAMFTEANADRGSV